jgi:hypothetical protein
MKIKLSKSQWEQAGISAGWMKTSQIIPDDGFADGGERYTDEEMDLMEKTKKMKDKRNPPKLNGKPILNPEDEQGENLYEVAIGGVCNTGLIGFDGYVYAFDEGEAVDKVFDKYPNLGISQEDLKNYKEDEISYGGNNSIPYLAEDLRGLKLERKATF